MGRLLFNSRVLRGLAFVLAVPGEEGYWLQVIFGTLIIGLAEFH